MISIAELKNIEPPLENMSDEALENIRSLIYAHAHLALECFLESKLDCKTCSLGSKQKEGDVEQLSLCKMTKQKKE